jgi:hypothetical protein
MKKNLFRMLFIFSAFVFSPLIYGQDGCACCSAIHEQFDFWVGDWEVKNEAGELLGTNKIEKLEEGCLLAETWQGANNSSGRSLNYYQPDTHTWHQLWISSTGQILELEGRLEGEKMVLTGPLKLDAEVPYRNQISWTPNPDGTVTQEWAILTGGGPEKEVIFLGIYHSRITSVPQKNN